MADTESEGVGVQVGWEGSESAPVLSANVFAVQLGGMVDGEPEEIILLVGHATPPIFRGTPEEQLAALKDLEVVPARPLARFSLRRGRAAELASLLTQAVEQFDAHKAGEVS